MRRFSAFFKAILINRSPLISKEQINADANRLVTLGLEKAQ